MTHSTSLRIAAAQYDLTRFHQWDEYVLKLQRWVETAVANQAQLLVFPEYGALELTTLESPSTRSIRVEGLTISQSFSRLQDHLPAFLKLHQTLAQTYQIYLLAASLPVIVAPQQYCNRAYLFAPSGVLGFQDKIQLTRFEQATGMMNSGSSLKVFHTDYGKLGIAICYDSEFPLLVRSQVAADAEIILVPSCTDTLAGYHRVHLSSRARALENQCYVVQSTLVGNVDWSPLVDVNIGAAGVYGPIDHGFPDDGLLALGTLNTPQWVYADLHLTQITEVRSQGQVLNYQDWPKSHDKMVVEVLS